MCRDINVQKKLHWQKQKLCLEKKKQVLSSLLIGTTLVPPRINQQYETERTIEDNLYSSCCWRTNREAPHPERVSCSPNPNHPSPSLVTNPVFYSDYPRPSEKIKGVTNDEIWGDDMYAQTWHLYDSSVSVWWSAARLAGRSFCPHFPGIGSDDPLP